jgi:hypothetical protein
VLLNAVTPQTMNASAPISTKNLTGLNCLGHLLTIQSHAILVAKHFRELRSTLTAAQG